MAKTLSAPPWTPRLLRKERAAAYLDIGVTYFDRLVRDGVLPRPKLLSGVKCWDRADLDHAADNLPTDDPAVDLSWED
jgi:predicted DNA-binding transcriptional regulator AlpA